MKASVSVNFRSSWLPICLLLVFGSIPEIVQGQMSVGMACDILCPTWDPLPPGVQWLPRYWNPPPPPPPPVNGVPYPPPPPDLTGTWTTGGSFGG